MRFIVRKPDADEPDAARRQLGATDGVKIIADNAGLSFLVEQNVPDAALLEAQLPGWNVFPERTIARPEPPFPRTSWKN